MNAVLFQATGEIVSPSNVQKGTRSATAQARFALRGQFPTMKERNHEKRME